MPSHGAELCCKSGVGSQLVSRISNLAFVLLSRPPKMPRVQKQRPAGATTVHNFRQQHNYNHHTQQQQQQNGSSTAVDLIACLQHSSLHRWNFVVCNGLGCGPGLGSGLTYNCQADDDPLIPLKQNHSFDIG